MAQFFTEIPCNPSIGGDAFLRCCVEWLREAKGCFILPDLEKQIEKGGDPNEISVSTPKGESLRFRRVPGQEGSLTVGFRYEQPDSDGHLWRTEAVLHNDGSDAFVTTRVTCLAADDGAVVLEPKKSYFVKLMLKKAWGASDGDFTVADYPHILSSTDVEVAAKAIRGEASCLLPIVYVSAGSNDRPAINVDKLAYDLGGVAHVIVEPDRSFSFRLKDCCNANNPYGGALGVSLVGRPNILRIVPNRVGFDEYRFRQQVIDLISHRTPRFGLDWSGLSELKTHYIVEKLRNDRKTDTDGQVEQWIKTFESEIDAMQNEMSSKDEEITRLRNELAQLDQRKLDNVGNADKVVNLDKLTSAIAEVYPGEIGDRARALFKHQADLGSNADGGERGAHIFNMLAELISPSGNLRAFKDEIKKLSSDPKQLRKWLRQKSWNERDGNHIVMTPPTQLRGVHQLTLPKTASDHRAGKNTARDLVAAMGLQSLKDQSRT